MIANRLGLNLDDEGFQTDQSYGKGAADGHIRLYFSPCQMQAGNCHEEGRMSNIAVVTGASSGLAERPISVQQTHSKPLLQQPLGQLIM